MQEGAYFVNKEGIGRSWEELEREIFTEEEIIESNLRVALISESIKSTQRKKYPNKKFYEKYE